MLPRKYVLLAATSRVNARAFCVRIGRMAAAGWVAACTGTGVPVLAPPCEGPSCADACQDSESACLGDSAAICEHGFWSSRFCEKGCWLGRCLECRDGDHGCVGPLARTCVDGRFEETSCEPGTCVEGTCACRPGDARCAPGGRQVCDADAQWSTLDPCPESRPDCVGGTCVACEPSTRRCLDEHTLELCSHAGDRERIPCPKGCDDTALECRAVCTPGERRCDGPDWVQECAAGGLGYVTVEGCDHPDASEARTCQEGACTSICGQAEATLDPSGCGFHAAPILTHKYNWGLRFEDQTCFVINPSASHLAVVTAFQQGEHLSTKSVAPGGVEMIGIPNHGRTLVLRSNRPIFVVHHLNVDPFGENPVSGDTAFLLPDHILRNYGKRYRVLTQSACKDRHFQLRPGGFALANIGEETVTLDIEWMARATPSPTMLGPEEVVQVVGTEENGDFTGTLITSERPLALFNAGASRIPCNAVSNPADQWHVQTQLVEQIMPVGLWGDPNGGPHVHVAAKRPGVSELWKVLSDEGPNGVRTVPASALAATLGTGGHQTFVAGSFRLESDRPVLLARYRSSSNQDPGGGSTFSLERPTPFWRSSYHLHALGQTDRLLAVVPRGEPVEVDGVVVSEARFEVAGAFEGFQLSVAPGVHQIRSRGAPFAVLMWGASTSTGRVYAYSGPVGFGDGY